MCYTLVEKEGDQMRSEEKIILELRAVENAIAQQRIEGLKVPPDVVEDMKRAARGEISIEEGLSRTFWKFAHGEVRGDRPLP